MRGLFVLCMINYMNKEILLIPSLLDLGAA